MAKRRNAADGREFLATPITSISESQLQALRDAQSWLPERLSPLTPMLREMLEAYEGIVPPHKRPIQVRIKILHRLTIF